MQSGQDLKCLINSGKFAFPCISIPPIMHRSSKNRTDNTITSGVVKLDFGEL